MLRIPGMPLLPGTLFRDVSIPWDLLNMQCHYLVLLAGQ